MWIPKDHLRNSRRNTSHLMVRPGWSHKVTYFNDDLIVKSILSYKKHRLQTGTCSQALKITPIHGMLHCIQWQPALCFIINIVSCSSAQKDNGVRCNVLFSTHLKLKTLRLLYCLCNHLVVFLLSKWAGKMYKPVCTWMPFWYNNFKNVCVDHTVRFEAS